MDDQNQIKNDQLANALKQIQGWFVNGEFDKVKRGCEEVLTIAPTNSIAQDLKKRAEEALAPSAPAAQPSPTTPPPPPPPTPMPGANPLEVAMPPMPEPMPMPMPIITTEETKPRWHSLAINLGILLGIVVLGIGGVFTYHALFKDTPTPEVVETVPTPEAEPEETDGKPGTEEETPSTEPEAATRNTERSQELGNIESALIRYYNVNKKYPQSSEVENELLASGFLTEIPTPPTAKETYVYAVYDTQLGPQQVFVLSAEFEEEDGTVNFWTLGGTMEAFPDYRDTSKPHVKVLTADQEPATEPEPEPTPVEQGGTPRGPRPIQ